MSAIIFARGPRPGRVSPSHARGAGLLGLTALLLSSAPVFAQDVDRMDRTVRASVEAGEFTGSVLVTRGDQVLLDRGYGMADREWGIANDGDTKFRLGSISKQFTSVAILLLVEQGFVDLDAPLKTYLPDTPAAWDTVTVRQLMSHTAGIPDFTRFEDFAARKTLPTTLPALIARFSDRPLDFTPGTQWAYSNSGYILLTAVVEKASGKPYAAYISERLFQPLGMADSGYDEAATILPHRASGYVRTADGFANADYVDMTVPQGAGALYSTTHDLLKWEQGLFGGRVLTPDSLTGLTTPVRNDYALGLISKEKDGHRIISHNGGIEGFNTWMARAEDGMTVVVLGNLNGPGPDKLGPALMTLAHGGEVALQSERQVIPVTAEVLNSYAGVYEASSTFAITVSVVDGRLMAQATGQPAFELFPERTDGFFLKVVDAQLTFNRDASGAVTGLVLHQGGNDLPARKIS
jgi:CubicO group peptidase (beta-lactamase class C family)